MRVRIVPILFVAIACAGPVAPPKEGSREESGGPGLWIGTCRYGGTRTELRREGRFHRFSDARLGGFPFRPTGDGVLEDDTSARRVRVLPDVHDDTPKSARPYRWLRMVFPDDTLLLIRVS